MSVRVDFSDGRQHEYEVRSAMAEQATGLLALAGPAGDAEALAAFTEARLAEAEATVHRAGEGRAAWVTVRDEAGGMLYTTVAADLEGEDDAWIADGSREIVDPAALVFYDTDRALRDIEAKRMILTRWRTACNQAEVARVNGGGPEEEAWEKIAGALELDVRSLAAVWDDHPDYKEGEWAL
jgi:hypothetical protein